MSEQWFEEQFPRSANYSPRWALENQMGPNVLWLTEALTQIMDLRPGMRVLDMGCGRAISSIFLAKEFGLQVWAADLWVGPNENWQRIQAANMDQQVFPLHAEAHNLPFAHEFFDAIVSMDAYHYFGTDDLYLTNHYARFVKPGGQIGIVVPGVTRELDLDLPDHLRPYWEPDYYTFHSPDWWRSHWEKTGLVEVGRADMVPDGWQHWLTWMEVRLQRGYPYDQKEAELVKADSGKYLGFTRMVARRKA